MDDKIIKGLARYSRSYHPHTVIFNQGDPGNRMYVILEGRVRISQIQKGAKDPQVLSELTGGAFFGEMSLFTGEPRSATAQTIETTRLVVLDRQEVLAVITGRPDFALRIIEGLCRRLQQTNTMIWNAARLWEEEKASQAEIREEKNGEGDMSEEA